jgi:DnaJ domain
MAKIDRDTVRQLNLYEVLQVSSKASPEVVQAAYRVLARAYHPDVNMSPNAARMMRQLNAAYTVLSDPERRARYDAQRAHGWRTRSATEHPVRPGRGSGSAAASKQPTPIRPDMPRTAVRGGGLPVEPVRSGWRIGRLAGLLLFLLLMFGALLFAFWLIAGFLEDEPLGPMRAAAWLAGVPS